MNPKKVRVVSPHPSQKSKESDDDRSDGASFLSLSARDDGSDYSASVYRGHPGSDQDNPFDEEWDEDDFDDEDLYHAAARRRRRGLPSKASQALGIDSDNPWRTSTVIGNHRTPSNHRDSTASESQMVPSKAQRMLGIAERGKTISEDDFKRQHSFSSQSNNIAPKALKTLGIPSNPFQKTGPSDTASVYGEEGDQYHITRPPGGKMDVDEFKRMLLSGERDPPGPMDSASLQHLHPNFPRRMNSSSSTDASSISQSSFLSNQDYRLETPRSSHEISPEDWNPQTQVPYP